jgi:hypothetical protein
MEMGSIQGTPIKRVVLGWNDNTKAFSSGAELKNGQEVDYGDNLELHEKINIRNGFVV